MAPTTVYRRGVRIFSQIGFARMAALGVVVLIAAFTCWSFAARGPAYVVLTGELSAAEKIIRLQRFFASLGAAAPLRDND